MTSKYKINIKQEVLKHLGLNLYSNIYAVLSEIVANSYDADATEVLISIKGDEIWIEDNGTGMTVDDANAKFLSIGYAKRKKEGTSSPKFNRPFMGRKGIGKLSLFSISNLIEIHCCKDKLSHGFIMNLDELKQACEDGTTYAPSELDPNYIKKTTDGVLIILSKLSKKFPDPAVITRRLARRFGLEVAKDFSIKINDQKIELEDRDYFDKLQYMWYFGDESKVFCERCKLPDSDKFLQDNKIISGANKYSIRGWIGTAKEAGSMKDGEENLNRIVIMTRGKLAQENVLDSIPEGGLYSKYLIGEIYADFLDSDEEGFDDIATSNRQAFFEGDERFIALKAHIVSVLKKIQPKWGELKGESGLQDALKTQEIKEWYDQLDALYQNQAKKIFGFINKLSFDNSEDKKLLYKHSIVAFESLKLTQKYLDINDNDENLMNIFPQMFRTVNDYSSIQYYLIVDKRLNVIQKLQECVDSSEKEKVLQNILFENLWLIDPVGEVLPGTPRNEEIIKKILNNYTGLSDEVKNSRTDITFQTINKKNVIIELKKAERKLKSGDLFAQIMKYKIGVEEHLKQNEDMNTISIVLVLGDYPADHDFYIKQFETANAKILTYDNIIIQAQHAYAEFLTSRKGTDRLAKIISSIDFVNFESDPPTPPQP